MSNEAKELSIEEMESVGGGLIVEDTMGKFWLVRQDGSIISPVSEDNAVSFAKAFNISTEKISVSDYEKRFGRSFEW